MENNDIYDADQKDKTMYTGTAVNKTKEKVSDIITRF